MTLPMIIALAVTVLMIILIMVDKLPFGCLLYTSPSPRDA